MLSGFILTYSHAGEKELGATFLKRFYFARFARIYPVYLLCLLAAAYVDWDQMVSARVHVVAYVADLLMVQTWSLRVVSFFNVPAWSVSSEVFFYLVFPFVFLRLRPSGDGRRTRRLALLGVAGFWLLAMAAPLMGLIWYPVGSWHEEGAMFPFWVRRFPVLALPEFLSGICLAWYFLLARPKRRSVWVMVVLPTALLLSALLFADHLPALMLHNGLLIPLYAWILLGLCEESWISRALSSRPLVLLGEASYSLYLVHLLFAVWVLETFHLNDGLQYLWWKLGAVLLLSVALHLGVERPSRKGLLRWWNTRHPRPARAG
jgi:peptidoglycan/LPS O-acetylase OafA/YrhL